MRAAVITKTGSSGSGLRRQSLRPVGIPNWLKSLPFALLHLAPLAILFTGTDARALVLCAVCYFIHLFGLTAGYHRYFAHRSYKTSRVFQFVLACLGCMALQKGPLWWVSHHRHHHRYSDTPEDVHSPLTGGFWWSHIGWVFSPASGTTRWDAIPDWSRYPELRWLDRGHWLPPLALAALCLVVGNWSGLVWGFLISTLLSHHAVFLVNSLCHLMGRRRYATSDASRNNLFVALLTLGEGWHNNHHHYQRSANQGFFWWEIDVSYYLIRLLACVGVVWDVRKPPRAKLLHRAGKTRTPTPPEQPAGLASSDPGRLDGRRRWAIATPLNGTAGA
jgi:stearoyl-CoA desaturase (delta-9 desaturase)